MIFMDSSIRMPVLIAIGCIIVYKCYAEAIHRPVTSPVRWVCGIGKWIVLCFVLLNAALTIIAVDLNKDAMRFIVPGGEALAFFLALHWIAPTIRSPRAS